MESNSTAFLIKIKLRHSLGRPSRSVFVQSEFLLSELFHPTTDEPALELKAVMLNINKGHNQELMNACHTLRDYSEYVARIRTYSGKMPLADAVEKTITECI